MIPFFKFIPIDKTTIKTRLRIHPDLSTNPEAFIRHHHLPIRSMKPTKGLSRNGPTTNLSLDVLTYRGIKVKLTQTAGDPLAKATIDFNPGKCLYGHNGRILTLTEFLHALALLVTHLTPLLLDPDDWVDLVPGLRDGGVAYWTYLEILSQFLDPDGRLLSAFRHLHRPRNGNVRHWPESIEAGGQRSKLRFSIYMKAIEMAARGKLSASELEIYKDILRLEARMKGKKLVDYFGNERNIEVIDGKKRLVRFYPADIVQGLRKSFREMLGVYSTDEVVKALGKKEQLRPMGQLLAHVALDPRVRQTFPELLALIKSYTGASSDTLRPIRAPGLAELSRRSSISFDDLFSDAAYEAQPSIEVEELEAKIRHEFEDTVGHHLIESAYQPPGLPFSPLTELPSYCR